MASVVQRRGVVDMDSILACALELFANRGYQATTMDDVGAALGIRGPSLYKHVRSKQELLVAIMRETMNALIRDQGAALASSGNVSTRLRRAVEAHVRYQAAHQHEAIVGNREIGSLENDHRLRILELRDAYERRLRSLIEEGCLANEFSVQSSKLASFAILEMGMGVAAWFDPNGDFSVDQVAYMYSEIAIRIVRIGGNLEFE